jgi:hypothetical protein
MKDATCRISAPILAAAIGTVRSMDNKHKEALVDEIHRAQPNMLASFLVQSQLGVSYEKMEFLLEILLICYQAMKQSKHVWPRITEDDQAREMARYVATIQFGEGLHKSVHRDLINQYIDQHPEPYLYAFAQNETNDWLQRISPEQSDTQVMLAAANFVNCIAFAKLPKAVVMPAKKTKPR